MSNASYPNRVLLLIAATTLLRLVDTDRHR